VMLALGQIDKVHRHDDAPGTRTIPVVVDDLAEDWGQFGWASMFGPPAMIKINEQMWTGDGEDGPSPPVGATVVHHEVGHYVDRQVLGQNFFQSVPEMVTLDEQGRPVLLPDEHAPPHQREMDELFRVLGRTNAVQRLLGLRKGEPELVDITLSDGTRLRGTGAPDVGYVRYNLRPDEMFARAYAQWVALRSGDPVALRGIREDQRGGVGQHRTGLWYARQWEWRDFAPVAEAMDELFAAYGLLNPEARGADPAGVMKPQPQADTSFVDTWEEELGKAAAGLDLTQPDERATFRIRVQDATANLSVAGLRELADHLGAPRRRDRFSLTREVADAWIARVAGGGA
jgi:hypothetical protein